MTTVADDDDKYAAIRSALDAVPGSPPNMTAEMCVSVTLEKQGFLIVPGGVLPAARWNSDKPHRCPRCHAVAVSMGRPRPWLVYQCCRCASRFTRWPALARILPFAGIRCAEHREAPRG
jgi:hypothetical protein